MAERYTPKEMLAKLVSFPTVSRESNLDLIDWVEDYLKSHGVEATRVYNDEGTKASLYAHVGPMVEGGVVLSGHTDVVPVDGQEWTSDPFTLTERDGLLHGRGACDMKGFDALALAFVPDMLEAGLTRPIQIALSHDEEIGCVGAPAMIAHMRRSLPVAEAVIVGEPSMMEAVTGHKGGVGFTTRVRGYEVHSSLVHTGVSAVMTAARLVAWHEERMAENRALAMAKPGDDVAGAFNPPYTTLHVGKISGGTAVNITAKDCEFTTDIRVVPTEDRHAWRDRYFAHVRDVEAQIRAIRPEAGIEVELRNFTPGCRPEENGAAERLVRSITGDNARHVVSYGTEGGQFQEAGYSVVICGPGSIEQAHQADEYLSVAQLEAGAAFMRRLIERMSG